MNKADVEQAMVKVNYRLPKIVVEKLEAEARRQGRNPSEFVRLYLTALVDEESIAQQVNDHLQEIEHLLEALEEVRNRAGAMFPGEPAKTLEGPHDLVRVPLPGAADGVMIKVERADAIAAGLWPPGDEDESKSSEQSETS